LVNLACDVEFAFGDVGHGETELEKILGPER
jgi:hypothetical protein